MATKNETAEKVQEFETIEMVNAEGKSRFATSAAGQIGLEFDGYRIKKGETDLAEKAVVEVATPEATPKKS